MATAFLPTACPSWNKGKPPTLTKFMTLDILIRLRFFVSPNNNKKTHGTA
jgi:hypothetical protein